MGEMITGRDGFAYPCHISVYRKDYYFGQRGTTISFNIYKYFLK